MTTNYRKALLTLPPEVYSAFAQHAGDTETRNQYITVLRGLKWTLQSIADASGVTRERVRQIIKDTEVTPSALLNSLPTPTPPVALTRATKSPRVYIEPDPVKLARLRELKPLAQQVRSNSPKYRAEAEEYTRIIADVHLNDKVTLYRLAMRLGVTHGALRFRLARYGYKSPSSGAKGAVYTTILEENRVR